MITNTGVWSKEESHAHIFSFKIAQWIGHYLSKKKPLFDFGCGQATYLSYFNSIGFDDLTGIEGSEIDFEYPVLIQDLTIPFNLDKKGNIICLEVWEHIPAEYEDILIENIKNHCNGKLIISVALEGQDGLGHVNCRNNDYVIEKLTAHGFVFNQKDTDKIRKVPENFVAYFRNTLMVYDFIQ